MGGGGGGGGVQIRNNFRWQKWISVAHLRFSLEHEVSSQWSRKLLYLLIMMHLAWGERLPTDINNRYLWFHSNKTSIMQVTMRAKLMCLTTKLMCLSFFRQRLGLSGSESQIQLQGAFLEQHPSTQTEAETSGTKQEWINKREPFSKSDDQSASQLTRHSFK